MITPTVADLTAAIAVCEALHIDVSDADAMLNEYTHNIWTGLDGGECLRLATDSLCCAVLRWVWTSGNVDKKGAVDEWDFINAAHDADLPALTAALKQIGGAK